MDGDRCPQPGCDGHIEAGFCNRCGLEPVATPAAVSVPSARTGGGSRVSAGSALSARSGSRGSRRTGSTRSSTRKHLGLGLITVPQLPAIDPEKIILADAQVPEHKRFCGNPDCHDTQGQPTPLKRVAGHCPQCGQRYSFVPSLKPGDVVGEQYEVKGCLAYGGLGWIYLARDLTLGRWVVLKGLLNTADEAAAAAAVAERQFLAAVKHPNIVGIYNFVTRGPEGFIVMEYVAGTTVKDLRKQRGPLPPAEAIAYVHRILGAFSYLHQQGFVYCDMKPDNFMLEGDPPDVKLIDLGGVRMLEDADSDIFSTRGYSAPELAEGPTVEADLYSLGRTLAVLIMDFRFQSAYERSLPPPAEQPVLAKHESLYRFLVRATDPDPLRRFASADAMADQLAGVLRTVVAETGEAPLPPVESTLFFGDPQAARGEEDDLKLGPALLPDLRMSTDDPAAAFLLSTAAVTDPKKLVGQLRGALKQFPESVELPLCLIRCLITLGEHGEAGTRLKELEARVPDEWRAEWYRGLLELGKPTPPGPPSLRGKGGDQTDDVVRSPKTMPIRTPPFPLREGGPGGVGSAALATFDDLFHQLPGEPAVKLALAVAAEVAGDLATAIKYYDLVSRSDVSYTTAALGLGRCLAAQGKRAEAATAYRRIPATSSLHEAAQVRVIRTLLAGKPAAPGPAEVKEAAQVLEALDLQPPEKAPLEAAILEAAIPLAKTGPAAGALLLGQPWQEVPLRRALEAALRQMARHATDRAAQIALVDRANGVRPVTWV